MSASAWDSRYVKTDVGADVAEDNTGRPIIEAWASGAHSIPMTVAAAKDMIEALQYSVRTVEGRNHE